LSKVTSSLEVYADIWCPFAHVGLRAARLERDQLGRSEVKMFIHPWPLELVNGRPLDPEVTLRHVQELREQVAPDLFADFNVATFPSSTLPALALAADAYRRDAGTGEAVSWALRDALFESGRDVSDPAVLGEIARRFSLAHDATSQTDAVVEEWHLGQIRGVKGSPHFFCGAHEAFCPTLDIDRDERGGLTLRNSEGQLASFLEACFNDGPDGSNVPG
jgi:predicted DsbA family dithiol-disulfide isomerase